MVVATSMGGCFGIYLNRRSQNNANDNTDQRPSDTPANRKVGKNHPLRREAIRWRSDIALTLGQLLSKRDEFWDTAPAFDGRKEIWDALRAASDAADTDDFDLAQAIVDGANITLPNGTLTDCYDELGNRYQLPIYVLSNPVNLIKETDDRDSPSDTSEPLIVGTEVYLKVRLSTTGRDTKLAVRSTDSIATAKRRLQSQEGIEASRQRWYFGGKILHDKLRVEEAKIPAQFVVQVIVGPELQAKVDS